MLYEKIKFIRCCCGGIIGMYNRQDFTCETCGKEYQLHKLNYDRCMINDKTGWIFPIIETEIQNGR